MEQQFEPLVAAGDAPTYTMHEVTFTGLAAPSRGTSESAVWIVSIPPGVEPASHSLTREEVFVGLSGRARATLGGKIYELHEGCAFVVPAHIEFSLANPYGEPFRAVVVLPVGGQARIGETTFTPPWAE